MLPSYGYSELSDEGEYIRLLKVSPGQKEDYIYCRLEPVPLADVRGTYECISYVWGTNTETRRIVVDGHEFPVTLNLFHALQHFRLPDRERTLWADAICIAQLNPAEKGAQVQLMGKIYESALKTLVWLGVDREEVAEETREFFEVTGAAARNVCGKYGLDKIPALEGKDNPFSQDARKWALFTRFISFPWFTRTWVIQEVGIAPEVSFQWGDTEIKLYDIINVNEIQRHAPHLFTHLVFSWILHDTFNGVFMTYENKVTWRDHVVQDFLVQNKKLVPHQTVLDILLQSSRRDVTDKRDHIYAFLAHPLLRLEDGNTIVRADYKRDADDVYLDVTEKVLEQLDATLTLSVAGGMGARRDRDLDGDQPSWVIQWDLGKGCFTIGRLEQWFHAGDKDVQASIKIDADTKTLRTTAVIFDKLVWVSPQIQESQVQLDLLAKDASAGIAMEDIWEALPEEPCRYAGKYGSRDAYTMSLVCGSHGHRHDASQDLIRHRKLANAYLDYAKHLTSAETKANEVLKKDAREFENDFALFAKARRFVVSEKGFYGLGAQLVKEGDVLAVIPGIRVTWILRPIGANYRYVGAAYVHGAMNGEVLDEMDPLGLNAGRPEEVVIV